MNALTTTKGPQLPVLSPALQQRVCAGPANVYASRDPEDRFRLARHMPDPTPDEVVEARRVLAGYVAMQGPTPTAMRQWLMALNAAVANPQGQQAFEMRFGAYASLLNEYPAQVFTQETLKDAMRTFEFFPSAAKLTDLLDKHLQAIRDIEAGLRRVANFREIEEEEWTPPTPEQHQAVTDLMQSWKAEKAEIQREAKAEDKKDRPAGGAQHLSDESLLAIAEKQARDGADHHFRTLGKYRATMLRARLGLPQPEEDADVGAE